RCRDPSDQLQAEPGGLRAVGRLCAEEGKTDRRRPAPHSEGGASVALVGEEVLRQPALLGNQQGADGAGLYADRLATAECVNPSLAGQEIQTAPTGRSPASGVA